MGIQAGSSGYLTSAGTVNSLFTNNASGRYGGALAFAGSGALAVTNSAFRNNSNNATAAGQYGGAV